MLPFDVPPVRAQGGGWGPPPGPPGPQGPPGGYPGGFAPAPPPPGGFQPPGGKPITGSPQTMALHAMTIDPVTGLPRGEKPPASTAAIVALVCGVLLCLGPLTGITAIVAGVMAKKAIAADPNGVGGAGMALAGIILGCVNLVGSAIGLVLMLISAVA